MAIFQPIVGQVNAAGKPNSSVAFGIAVKFPEDYRPEGSAD